MLLVISLNAKPKVNYLNPCYNYYQSVKNFY